MPSYFTPQLRRRLSSLLLVVGVLLLGKLAQDELPLEQKVRFRLTPSQQSNAQAVRVTYAVDGDVLSGVEQRFQGQAPAEFVHTPSLRPGRYAVSIDVVGRDGAVTRLDRALRVPSEATPTISLAERP